MRVTKKGQVTIPSHIRKILGIMPGSEVEFIEDDGRIYIDKKENPKKSKSFRKYRGVATIKMITDEIMALTRGDQGPRNYPLI